MAKTVDVLGLLQAGIRAEDLRQKTIASNIANLETPGYRRLDVRFEDALVRALSSGQAGAAADVQPEVFEPASTFVKPNGNDVSLEMEIGEMLKNTSRQTAFIRILHRKYAQIENAVTIRE